MRFSFSYSYDKNERLLSIEAPHFGQTIEYDPAGNILSLQSKGGSARFAYDPLYQLTQESGPFDQTFRFDSIGCCLKAKTASTGS